MTSIIKVDQIQNAAGGVPTLSSLGVTGSGTVLQQITGYCDGRTVNGITFPTVSNYQDLNASYQDITGSSISYTPPANTTTVVYRFNFKWASAGTSGISHWKVFLDNTEVTIARSTIASQYDANQHGRFHQEIVVPFLIGGTDDIANAKLSSWTSAKTIKVQGREYDNSTYHVSVHSNLWWDGGSASGTDAAYMTPTITLTALS